MENKGIPKEIVNELDIKREKKDKKYNVAVSVSEHQAKISIPKIIVMELGLTKNQSCEVTYDKKKKELICKF